MTVIFFLSPPVFMEQSDKYWHNIDYKANCNVVVGFSIEICFLNVIELDPFTVYLIFVYER